MRDRFDVVVIGAGLGGLAAAAALARDGFSVLLVERHSEAGGYASSFRRKAFVFEVSLHLMDAIGPGEPGRELLESLGISTLEFLSPAVLRRELGADGAFEIPRGRVAFEAVIGDRFPRELDGFRALFELGAEAQRASLEEERTLGVEARLGRLGSIARATASEVVDAKLGDRALIAVLERFAIGWLGRPLAVLRAPEFLVPWFSYHALTAGYPVGGSAALAGALVNVIAEAGGEVSLGCGARRVVVGRRRVEAVEFEDGRRVECRAVVSNACPAITFGSLIDPRELDPGERARMGKLAPSVSSLKVWIGTSQPIAAEAYETDLLATAPANEERFDPGTRALSVVVPSVLGRGVSTPEGCVLSASTLVRPAALDESADRGALAEAVIARIERALFPGLAANVAHWEVATPKTFEKFTANPAGAIYGGFVQGGVLDGWRPGAETSIERLFLAGAWTQPGAGFTTTLRSGQRAARAAARALRRLRR